MNYGDIDRLNELMAKPKVDLTFEQELEAARERDRIAREENAELVERARRYDQHIMEHGLPATARERLSKDYLESRDRYQKRVAAGGKLFTTPIVADGAEPGMFE